MAQHELLSPVLRSPRVMHVCARSPPRKRSASSVSSTPTLANARLSPRPSATRVERGAGRVAGGGYRAVIALLLVLAMLGGSTRLLHMRRRPVLNHDGVDVDPSHPHERFTGASGAQFASEQAAVMVFAGSEAPQYMPTMFRSAAANARDLDLLFVNVQDATGACLDLTHLTDPARPTYAPNIQHLCLSLAENDALVSRWLCDGWGGCSESDRGTVAYHLERLRTELLGPDTFSTFRVRQRHPRSLIPAALQGPHISLAHPHAMVGLREHRSRASPARCRTADVAEDLRSILRISAVRHPWQLCVWASIACADRLVDMMFTTHFDLSTRALFTPVRHPVAARTDA